MPGIVQAHVTGSTRAVLKHLDKTRKVSQKSTVTALNKTAKKLLVPAKRQIAASTNLRAKDVAKRLRVGQASRRRPVSALRMLMRPIPWIQLNAKQLGGSRPRGVRAGKHVDRDAFIAKGLGGHEQVFRREGPERTPLEVLRVELEEKAHPILRRTVRGSAPIFKRFYKEQMARWTKRQNKRGR